MKAKRDRFVARMAGSQTGTLITPIVTLDGDSLTLNVEAPRGEVRVQVTDANGTPLPGFASEDCRPISVDSLTPPVEWKGQIASLRGKAVRLEFSLRDANLFAFAVGGTQ